jgi:hypothetical protein
VYLRSQGATVTDIEDPERAAYRAGLGVPDAAASCHTAVVDGYILEGHVPAEAIRRLLDERPTLIGLALPGMPPDSPGMGGNEATWRTQQVLAVAEDSSLDPYQY